MVVLRFVLKTRSRDSLQRSFIRFLLSSLSAEANASASDKTAVDEIRRKQHRILVIDDDDRFRSSFCFRLTRKYGAQVTDVNSGRAGIERVRNGGSYDLVLTDIMMPEMTGVETYYELRKIDANIPIALMSAYSDSQEWKRAQELKDAVLIHKPVQEDALIKILSGLKQE